MESHRLVVNVEVAVFRDGRYLAIGRGNGEDYGAGWLGFPGGKVERERDTRDILEGTARREVLEETGLAVEDPIVYVESHTFAVAGEVVLDIVMLARAAAGEAYAASPEEVGELAWLTLEDFVADPRTQPWTRDSLLIVERTRQDLGW